MEVRRLDTSNTDEVAFIEALYKASFPWSERRPVSAMLDLYNNDSRFIITLAAEREKIVGFLTYWDLDDFIFAEHFAISPEYRNGGYGGKVMQMCIDDASKPIVLEVELPNTILSERRIGFYQRMGFKLWTNVQYQQPPYHAETNAIPMKLMSIGDIDVEKNIKHIRSAIYRNVYQY